MNITSPEWAGSTSESRFIGGDMRGGVSDRLVWLSAAIFGHAAIWACADHPTVVLINVPCSDSHSSFLHTGVISASDVWYSVQASKVKSSRTWKGYAALLLFLLAYCHSKHLVGGTGSLLRPTMWAHGQRGFLHVQLNFTNASVCTAATRFIWGFIKSRSGSRSTSFCLVFRTYFATTL